MDKYLLSIHCFAACSTHLKAQKLVRRICKQLGPGYQSQDLRASPDRRGTFDFSLVHSFESPGYEAALAHVVEEAQRLGHHWRIMRLERSSHGRLWGNLLYTAQGRSSWGQFPEVILADLFVDSVEDLEQGQQLFQTMNP